MFCFVFYQESMRLSSKDSCRIYYTMSYLHKSNTQKMFTPQKSFIHLFDEIIISKYFLSTCLLWYIIGSTLLPFGNVFDPVFHRQTMVLFAGEAMSARVMSLIPIDTHCNKGDRENINTGLASPQSGIAQGQQRYIGLHSVLGLLTAVCPNVSKSNKSNPRPHGTSNIHRQ